MFSKVMMSISKPIIIRNKAYLLLSRGGKEEEDRNQVPADDEEQRIDAEDEHTVPEHRVHHGGDFRTGPGQVRAVHLLRAHNLKGAQGIHLKYMYSNE